MRPPKPGPPPPPAEGSQVRTLSALAVWTSLARGSNPVSQRRPRSGPRASGLCEGLKAEIRRPLSALPIISLSFPLLSLSLSSLSPFLTATSQWAQPQHPHNPQLGPFSTSRIKMLPDPKQLKKPTINMGPGKLIAALLLSLSIYIRVFSLAIEIQSNPNDQHEDRRHSAAPLKSSAHYFVHSNHHRDHIDRANGYLYTAPPSNRSSRFKSSQMMATPHQLDQFDDQQDDENGRGTTFEGQILSDYGTTEEHQDTSRLFGHHSQHDAQHIHREQDNNNLEQPSLGQFPDQERTYISREYVREVCKLDRGSQRSEPLNNTYLNYCFRYKLENLLSNEILMSIMHRDSDDCERILGEFIQLDGMINQFDHLFKKLLTRYNCQNGYSVKWSCEDCKVSTGINF